MAASSAETRVEATPLVDTASRSSERSKHRRALAAVLCARGFAITSGILGMVLLVGVGASCLIAAAALAKRHLC